MSCRRTIDDFLMRYFEGGLTLSERIRFNLHLAMCIHCRRYLDSYRKTMALEKAAGASDDDSQPPPDMPEQLVKAILAARAADET